MRTILSLAPSVSLGEFSDPGVQSDKHTPIPNKATPPPRNHTVPTNPSSIMVVLSASISSGSGKSLVSRQFVEMNRMRVEGLLAAFPKLAFGDNNCCSVLTRRRMAMTNRQAVKKSLHEPSLSLSLFSYAINMGVWRKGGSFLMETIFCRWCRRCLWELVALTFSMQGVGYTLAPVAGFFLVGIFGEASEFTW